MSESKESNNTPTNNSDNIVDKLAKLSQLKESGAITPEEFQKIKTNLLGGRSADVEGATNAIPVTQGTIQAPETSGMAIASFILGLLGIIIWPLLILALILGFVALSRIKRSGGLLSGRGFAVAGVTIGITIGIIVLIICLVAVSVVGKIDKAKVTSTKANLMLLHSAVIQFKMDTGRYPTEEAGLQELIEQPTDVTGWNTGGYLETTKLPKDAWGHDFIYQLSPESGKPFVIISYGADGEEGGEGLNADLRSDTPLY